MVAGFLLFGVAVLLDPQGCYYIPVKKWQSRWRPEGGRRGQIL